MCFVAHTHTSIYLKHRICTDTTECGVPLCEDLRYLAVSGWKWSLSLYTELVYPKLIHSFMVWNMDP